MRPVDPDAVADLAAEQFVAGYSERFCFRVEQRIFDGAERLRHDAAGGGTGRCEQLGIDAFVLKRVLAHHPRREAPDRGTEPGRTETFVKFTPADDAVLGGELDKVVVPPAGIAGQQFDAFYLRCFRHGVSLVSCSGQGPHWIPFSIIVAAIYGVGHIPE